MEEKSFKILSRAKQVVFKKTEAPSDICITTEKIDIELNYLGVDGNVKERSLRIYLPKIPTKKKIPMIIGVHYEIPEDDRVIYEYVHCGWAVLIPINIFKTKCPNEIQGSLFSDKLDVLLGIGMKNNIN